jgi:hypothetical protein
MLTDNAGDLNSGLLIENLNKKGIQILNPTTYRPEHNGIVERMIGKLRSQIRTLLIATDAPPQLWNEAFHWSIHLQNSLPMKAVNDETPYERFGNYKFSLDKLKTWGCDAYVGISEPVRSKISSQAWLGICVGWSKRYQAYRIMNQEAKVLHKIDVRFDENSFTAMTELKKNINEGILKIKKTGTPVSESGYSFTIDAPEDYDEEEDYGPTIEVIEEERKTGPNDAFINKWTPFDQVFNKPARSRTRWTGKTCA